MSRHLNIRIYDTSFGIWQDNPHDATLRTSIYEALIKRMVAAGWSVRADPHILKHYRSLSPSHRLATRGDLQAALEISGRVVKIEFWADTWPIENQNGRRHEFGKMAKFRYLDRQRVKLFMSQTIDWLKTIAFVQVTDTNSENVAFGAMTALRAIEADYASSVHKGRALGRPVTTASYNSTSKDGVTIEQGQTVWFAGRKGRIFRGTAYYNINNMWWVVCGRYARHNCSAWEIYCRRPLDLRCKLNERLRRSRLEAELAMAVRAMDFQRAQILKDVLFGTAPTYLIWHREHAAYYRANGSGYTADVIAAGRFTFDEAMKEVRSHPALLEAVDGSGQHIRAKAA